MSMIENCSLTDNMTNKAIRDQHRELFAEMVKKTGSQQSVLDRMLQEIQFLRDHEGGPMDEEVIDILRGKIADLERQRDAMLSDARRYRWLRIHGLQRAWVSLGTDCDGENFADFKCEFKVPEPPNLPYEDDEGLEWKDDDFDAAIDAAIAAARKEQGK